MKLEGLYQLPLPLPEGTAGQTVEVQSNVFGIVVDVTKTLRRQSAYSYDVSITGTRMDNADFTDPNFKPLWLTKKSTADVYTTERKARAGASFAILLARFPEVFSTPRRIVYDRQGILYTMDKFNFKGSFSATIKLTPEESTGPLDGFAHLDIKVKESEMDYERLLDAYKELDNTPAGMVRDRSICQFLEISLHQYALEHPESFLVFEKGKTYLRKAEAYGVSPVDIKEIADGKELKVGAKLSVQIVEGPKGRDRANLSLTIDAKKAAFHSCMMLPDKAVKILNGFHFANSCDKQQIEKLNAVLRGLMIRTTHRKSSKMYRIVEVGKDAGCKISLDGKSVTIFDYYKDRYGIELKAPRAPLVIVQAQKETFFPMEVCMVAEDQRVSFAQQTPEQMKETTKECAVPPIRRQNLITLNSLALHIFDGQPDEVFRVVQDPMKVPARKLQPPLIQYNNGHGSSIDEDRFTWKMQRGAQYLVSGSIERWAFVVVSKGELRKERFIPFAEKYYNECKGRGIRMNPPLTTESINVTDLENFFEVLSANKVEFTLFIVDDRVSIQDRIKGLERKFEILTQNVRAKTAMDVIEKGKFMTLENICQKTNIKLGGINYAVKINGNTLLQQGEILVVGISALESPPGVTMDAGKGLRASIPTIVGFSANIGNDPDAFCGDFEIVDSKSDGAQLVGVKILDYCLEEWRKRHGAVGTKSRPRLTKEPKRIIIFRTGAANGAFNKVCIDEYRKIKTTLADDEETKESKLTYISVSKDHALRLFKTFINGDDKVSKQNIEPGTVVDKVLTNPKLRQFYLTSHTALNGCTQTPLYTVIADDANYSMDYLQGFIYKLCYMHQIVYLPTSIPSPLYIANRYAERGRRILIDYVSKTAAGVRQSAGVELEKVDPLNLLSPDMRKRLIYRESKFARIRVNA